MSSERAIDLSTVESKRNASLSTAFPWEEPTDDHRFGTHAIYQTVNALERFNAHYRSIVAKTFEAFKGLLPTHFLFEKLEETSHNEPPLRFSPKYFAVKQLSKQFVESFQQEILSDKKRVDAILQALTCFENEDFAGRSSLTEAVTFVRDRVLVPGKISPRNQEESRLERRLLHHHFLILTSSIARDSLLSDLLYQHQSSHGGRPQAWLARARPVPSTRKRPNRLPRLSFQPASSDAQQVLDWWSARCPKNEREQERTGPSALNEFYTEFLVPLFRELPSPHDIAGERILKKLREWTPGETRVSYSTDLLLLCLPVYDCWEDQRRPPAGTFLGWLLGFLPDKVELLPKAFQGLYERCAAAIVRFADDVINAEIEECLKEPFRPGEDALGFVCRHLNRVEGWYPVEGSPQLEVDNHTIGASGYFGYNPESEVLCVDLDKTWPSPAIDGASRRIFLRKRRTTIVPDPQAGSDYLVGLVRRVRNFCSRADLLSSLLQSGQQLGRADVWEDFSHETKQAAQALRDFWSLPLNETETQALLPALRKRFPNVPDRFRLLPFPDVLESASFLIELWATARSPLFLFRGRKPCTIREVAELSWRLARDSIKAALPLHNHPDQIFTVAPKWLATIDGIWAFSRCVVVYEDGPASASVLENSDWLKDVTRLLIAIFRNVIQHSHPDKAIRILLRLSPPALNIKISSFRDDATTNSLRGDLRALNDAREKRKRHEKVGSGFAVIRRLVEGPVLQGRAESWEAYLKEPPPEHFEATIDIPFPSL